MEFEVDPQNPPSDIGLRFSNSQGEEYILGLNVEQNEFFTDRRQSGKTDFSEHFPKIHVAPRSSNSNKVKMRVFLDHASLEFFADDNEVVFTDIFFSNENFSEIEAFSEGGTVKLKSGTIYPLQKMQITTAAK